MNFKLKIFSFIVIVLLFVSRPIHSQGIFKNNTQTTEVNTSNNGGILRGDPTGPPDQPPGETDSPVGEGIAVLSLLSGGFFILKRKNSKE